MNIILLGPPGAGKGSQAKYICQSYNMPHISTGDMFRANISLQTELGKLAKEYTDRGDLVPDYITIKMVQERLKEEDCREGFLLDGFPRTVEQAQGLEAILKETGIAIHKVIFIDVPERVIVERNTGRRICSKCGATFHVKFKPSKLLDKCEHCEGMLIQRKDDTVEAITNRMSVYKLQTNPLAEFYDSKKLLYTINGNQPAEAVFQNILLHLQASSSREQMA